MVCHGLHALMTKVAPTVVTGTEQGGALAGELVCALERPRQVVVPRRADRGDATAGVAGLVGPLRTVEADPR